MPEQPHSAAKRKTRRLPPIQKQLLEQRLTAFCEQRIPPRVRGQIRYDRQKGHFSLYCADRNDKWHRYKMKGCDMFDVVAWLEMVSITKEVLISGILGGLVGVARSGWRS